MVITNEHHPAAKKSLPPSQIEVAMACSNTSRSCCAEKTKPCLSDAEANLVVRLNLLVGPSQQKTRTPYSWHMVSSPIHAPLGPAQSLEHRHPSFFVSLRCGREWGVHLRLESGCDPWNLQCGAIWTHTIWAKAAGFFRPTTKAEWGNINWKRIRMTSEAFYCAQS